jgi:CRP-like cAMP-binding protein
VSDLDWALLRGLTDAQIEEILGLGRRRRFEHREVIWHEGDRADTFHLVRSGWIAVQMTTSLGEVATVAVWGPGQAAGLIDSFAPGKYHMTGAIALAPTESLAIRSEDLDEMRERLPAINDAIIGMLATKVVDVVLQLVDSHYVPADLRVLRRLVVLADLYEPGGGEVTIPLTQEDIAEIAGVTRPTVNRVLRREQQRATIVLLRGSITVIDRERLRKRAE